LKTSLVNSYLAHKQHLLSDSRLADVVQVTRDVVALHATAPTGPYLSLWARVPDFQRGMLEETLYDRRELARVLCMRTTLHAVPSDEVALFLQAYVEHQAPAQRQMAETLLLQAGMCQPGEAARMLERLHRQVLDVVADKGPSTVRQISGAVPELKAKVEYDADKSYGGTFSVGSRLVPAMCALGLLVRARPRGTWRSNLYEYAALSDWLPGVDLEPVTPEEARSWLVRRYLVTFGPATFEDIQWWTGFTKGETEEALRPLTTDVEEVSLEGLDNRYLMLSGEAQRLRGYTPPDIPYAFFLPGLDPYIMGYSDRRRFLAPEHRSKVFDRAGNAMPTVWAAGRVVGAWGQRKDGSVVYGLFEPVNEEGQALLEGERRRLEGFLGGEYLAPRTHTPFTRALMRD
jgi:hypothetical protein